MPGIDSDPVQGHADYLPLQVNLFNALPAGLQKITVEYSAYTKKSVEDGLSTAEQLLRARTPSEVVEINTAFLDRCLDSFFTEWSKMAGMLIGTGK